MPVAIAPRGYPSSPVPVQRLTAAYGGDADAVGLISTSAELAKQWKVRLRIASFTVRPFTMFGGSIERSAEELVVQQWTRKTHGRRGQAARGGPGRGPIPTSTW